MANMAADWEGIQQDLLVLIVKKIKLIEDLMAFGMVCKSWNEAATNNKQYLLPQIPWLLLAEDEITKNGRRQIYRLSSSSSDEKISTNSNRRSLYFSSDRKCIGLNYGWVLTISRLGGHMNLVHPLSGSEIKLPKQTSIENYDSYETWPTYAFTTRAAISGNPSESSDFTVMIAHSGGDFLGYWRPGDTCWTSNFDTISEFYDLIYSYKDDQFYAISCNGIIWACIIHHNQRNNIVLRQISKIDLSQVLDGGDLLVYIVESASPDVLLLVVREEAFVQEENEVCFNKREPVGVDEEGGKLYEDIHIKYGLVGFKVYELDLIKGSCSNKIINLGDRAIFVGHNTSISFDASQFIGIIKPNHIYFTDHCEEWYPNSIKGGGNNMGCYSLEDAKITQFNVGESRSRISPPFWFIPSL